MPKYDLYATVTGSKYLGRVECASEEEAETSGSQRVDCYVGLCHQCSRQIENIEITKITAVATTENDEYQND